MKNNYDNKRSSEFELCTLKKLNNVYYNLNDDIHGIENINESTNENSNKNTNENIEYVFCEDPQGNKAYERTLSFILDVCTRRVLENYRLRIEYSISKGLFCHFENRNEITVEEIKLINSAMEKMVSDELNIEKVLFSVDDAIKIFENQGDLDKSNLLNFHEGKYIYLYKLDNVYGYFFGELAHNTSVIKFFKLEKYKNGFVILYPTIEEPLKVPLFTPVETLYEIFEETGRWDDIMGLSNLSSLNNMINLGEDKNLISISEGLHEKKYVNIANEISLNDRIKIVLLSGPSSSGKTTSSKRLAVQLRVNGLKPYPIEMDNYFVNREDTPKLEDGSYDFESLKALDLDLFNSDMDKLIHGQSVVLPKFNFKTGMREEGETLSIEENGILIIEGIHALNPLVLENIKDRHKYKIYVSALTQLNLDMQNRLSTTDVRKLRRMVRDYNKRGYSGEDTLTMFKGVIKGEKKYIYPYQNEADVMFNSTIAYEIPVLKKYAMPLLREIKEDSEVFSEANRLITILSFVKDMDDKYIPPNSVLREFIGGSFFD